MLRSVADALEQEGDALARLLCLEPETRSPRRRVPKSAQCLKCCGSFAGSLSELKGTTLPWDDGQLCYTTRDPLGVVAAIIPWNAPLFLMARSSAVADRRQHAGDENRRAGAARRAALRSRSCRHAAAGVPTSFRLRPEAGKPLAEHPLRAQDHVHRVGRVGKEILRYAPTSSVR
jgi:hypothetical protein